MSQEEQQRRCPKCMAADGLKRARALTDRTDIELQSERYARALGLLEGVLGGLLNMELQLCAQHAAEWYRVMTGKRDQVSRG